MHSDSSQFAWAGVDQNGVVIRDSWSQKTHTWHINVKALGGAAHTIKSLAQPNQSVVLRVDNTVAQRYLSKVGGKKPLLNFLVRNLFLWCQQRNVSVTVERVPSKDCWADQPSRFWDKKRLLPRRQVVFPLKQSSPWLVPEWDMFASPSKSKLPKFCARHPHWKAELVESLACSL